MSKEIMLKVHKTTFTIVMKVKLCKMKKLKKMRFKKTILQMSNNFLILKIKMTIPQMMKIG